MNPNISVSHAHQLAENVRHALLSHHTGVSEVMVHVDTEMHDHQKEPSTAHHLTFDQEQELVQWAIENHKNVVKEVSHSTFHYRPEGIEVVLDIALKRDDLLIKEAQAIVVSIKNRLVQHDKVYKADVHLELNDSH